MKNRFFQITANFIAVVMLIGLIAAPIYFAKNAAKVAGVKTQSPYLLVSQIEKFPNLKLSQSGNTYQLNFTKLGESQAFLDVLILNNPTDQSKTYSIQKTSGDATLFFGHDPKNQKTQISVPSQTSIPISFLSENGTSDQTVEFTIRSN